MCLILNLILTLCSDFVEVCNSAVNEVLLRKDYFEDLLAVLEIDTVQVFGLGLLFSDDKNTIKRAQLWDVIKDLTAIMLLVLNWIEGEVKLCNEIQTLNKLQLQYFYDVVEGEV